MKLETISKINSNRSNNIKGLDTKVITEKQSLPIKSIEIFVASDGTPQPFKVEQADVDVLAESIKRYGQLTPITVRKQKNNKYQLLSGHKRYYAMLQNGFDNIDAKIIECDDGDAFNIVCNANIQRDKPKPSELNKMYHTYKDNIGEDRSVTELSKMFGVSSKTLYRCIHLDELIDELVKLVDDERVSTLAIETIKDLDNTQQTVLADFINVEEKAVSPSMAKKIVEMADEGVEFTVENIKNWLKPKKEQKEKKKYNVDFFNALAEENPDRYENVTEQELNDLIKMLLDDHFSDTF